MILYYPCKPLGVNQPFGINPQTYARFGINGHNGIDFFAPDGTGVFATHEGTVVQVGVDEYEGHGVVVEGVDEIGKYKTIYWHMKENEIAVKVGDKLSVGDFIGKADNTGFSTGSHLHFGLKRTDDNGDTLNNDNGFLGAIDPMPYFTGQFACDDKLGKLLALIKSIALQLLGILKGKQ